MLKEYFENKTNEQLKEELLHVANTYKNTYSEQVILEILRRLKNGNL